MDTPEQQFYRFATNLSSDWRIWRHPHDNNVAPILMQEGNHGFSAWIHITKEGLFELYLLYPNLPEPNEVWRYYKTLYEALAYVETERRRIKPV